MICNELSYTTPVNFDRYIVLPTVCAEVDSVAMYVVPVIYITGSTETIQYRDEIGNILSGTVTIADPCDCNCGCNE